MINKMTSENAAMTTEHSRGNETDQEFASLKNGNDDLTEFEVAKMKNPDFCAMGKLTDLHLSMNGVDMNVYRYENYTQILKPVRICLRRIPFIYQLHRPKTSTERIKLRKCFVNLENLNLSVNDRYLIHVTDSGLMKFQKVEETKNMTFPKCNVPQESSDIDIDEIFNDQPTIDERNESKEMNAANNFETMCEDDSFSLKWIGEESATDGESLKDLKPEICELMNDRLSVNNELPNSTVTVKIEPIQDSHLFDCATDAIVNVIKSESNINGLPISASYDSVSLKITDEEAMTDSDQDLITRITLSRFPIVKLSRLESDYIFKPKNHRKIGGKKKSNSHHQNCGPRVKRVCREESEVLGYPIARFKKICLTRKIFKTSQSSKSKKPKKNKIYKLDDKPGVKKRRKFGRCNKCEGCLKPNCQECIYCKDMKKYGGAFKIKQACKFRKCLNPIVPDSINISRAPPMMLKVCDETPSSSRQRKGNSLYHKILTKYFGTSIMSKSRIRSSKTVPNKVGNDRDNRFKAYLDSLSNLKENEVEKSAITKRVFIPKGKKIKQQFFRKFPGDFKFFTRNAVSSKPGFIRPYYRQDYDDDMMLGDGAALISETTNPLRVACFVCGSTGLDDLIYCALCCEPFHTFCLDSSDCPTISRIDNWCCKQCQYCSICGQNYQLVTCFKCQKSYHSDCLASSYPSFPLENYDRWCCCSCAQCERCGTNVDLRVSAHYSLLCTTCAELPNDKPCSVCERYVASNIDTKILRCVKCYKYVHKDCEGLTDDVYNMGLEMLDCYVCSTCSPYSTSEWKQKATSKLNLKLKAILNGFLSMLDRLHRFRSEINCDKQLKDVVCEQRKDNLSVEENVTMESLQELPFDDDNSEGHEDSKLLNLESPMETLDLENNRLTVVDNKPKLVNETNEAVCNEFFNHYKIEMKLKHKDYSNILSFIEDFVEAIDFKKQSAYTSWDELIKVLLKCIAAVFSWMSNCHNDNMINNALLNCVEHNYARPCPVPSSLNFSPQPSIFRNQDSRADKECSRVCSLCRGSEAEHYMYGGRMLYCGKDDWIHVNCAIWSSNVIVEKSGTLKGIFSAISKGNKTLCSCCGKLGATVSCTAPDCIACYHFVCAMEQGNVLLQEYRTVLCPDHHTFTDGNIVNEALLTGKQKIVIDANEIYDRKGRWEPNVEASRISILSGSLTVECLGEMCNSSYYGNCLIPVNFSCTRVYWSTKHPRKRTLYRCQAVLVFPETENQQLEEVNVTISHDQRIETIKTESNVHDFCDYFTVPKSPLLPATDLNSDNCVSGGEQIFSADTSNQQTMDEELPGLFSTAEEMKDKNESGPETCSTVTTEIICGEGEISDKTENTLTTSNFEEEVDLTQTIVQDFDYKEPFTIASPCLNVDGFLPPTGEVAPTSNEVFDGIIEESHTDILGGTENVQNLYSWRNKNITRCLRSKSSAQRRYNQNLSTIATGESSVPRVSFCGSPRSPTYLKLNGSSVKNKVTDKESLKLCRFAKKNGDFALNLALDAPIAVGNGSQSSSTFRNFLPNFYPKRNNHQKVREGERDEINDSSQIFSELAVANSTDSVDQPMGLVRSMNNDVTTQPSLRFSRACQTDCCADLEQVTGDASDVNSMLRENSESLRPAYPKFPNNFTKINPLKCPKCRRVYKTEASFTRHIQTCDFEISSSDEDESDPTATINILRNSPFVALERTSVDALNHVITTNTVNTQPTTNTPVAAIKRPRGRPKKIKPISELNPQPMETLPRIPGPLNVNSPQLVPIKPKLESHPCPRENVQSGVSFYQDIPNVCTNSSIPPFFDNSLMDSSLTVNTNVTPIIQESPDTYGEKLSCLPHEKEIQDSNLCSYPSLQLNIISAMPVSQLMPVSQILPSPVYQENHLSVINQFSPAPITICLPDPSTPNKTLGPPLYQLVSSPEFTLSQPVQLISPPPIATHVWQNQLELQPFFPNVMCNDNKPFETEQPSCFASSSLLQPVNEPAIMEANMSLHVTGSSHVESIDDSCNFFPTVIFNEAATQTTEYISDTILSECNDHVSASEDGEAQVPSMSGYENDAGTSNDDSSRQDAVVPRIEFEITSDDGFHVQSDDIDETWKTIAEMVQNERSKIQARRLSVDGISGLKMIGVTHGAVLYCLEQLPGARQCKNVKLLYRDGKTPLELLYNPSGCARSEKYKPRRFSSFHRFGFRQQRLPGENFEKENEDLSFKIASRRPPNGGSFRSNMRDSFGVFRSNIHGLGLFCKRNIEAGEQVLEYAGEIIRSTVADKREKYYESKGIGCYMFRIDDKEVVDATIHGNSARFINHSCEPNCFSKVITMDNKKHIGIFALKRIASGEELTYDYKFPIEEVKIPCTCASRKCRRFLN